MNERGLSDEKTDMQVIWTQIYCGELVCKGKLYRVCQPTLL